MERQSNKKSRELERWGILQKIFAAVVLLFIPSWLIAQEVTEKSGDTKEADSKIIGTGYFSEADIKLYPNPAADFLIIKSDVKLDEEITITLSGTNGAMLDKMVIGETSVNGNLSLDLTRYPSGQYIVGIRSKNGTFVAKKIIKR